MGNLMHIKARKITLTVVDEIKLTPEQWDTRTHKNTTLAWRESSAKLLNLRVTKLAPQYDAKEFYEKLLRFSTELGFGEAEVIAKVTERVYGVDLCFEDEVA
jgi:hypothetical protein